MTQLFETPPTTDEYTLRLRPEQKRLMVESMKQTISELKRKTSEAEQALAQLERRPVEKI